MSEEILKLKDVCEINGGYAFKSSNFKDSGVPIIRIGDISDNKVNISDTTVYIDADINDYEKFIINKGDILIALSGATTGKFGIYNYDKNSLLNQRVAKLKPKSIVKNRYLYHYMNKLQEDIYNSASGCAQPNISPSEISEKNIYIPNMESQEKIVRVLDTAQELIDKRKEQIEALDELVKSQFIEMFGEYFDDKHLEELDTVSDKITDGEHGTVPRVEKGIPYLMARNISVNNSLDFKEVSYIEQEVHEKIYSRCNPEQGYLLIVCVGATIGKVALVPDMEEFSMARSVALVKYDRAVIEGNYLLWLFNHNYMKSQLKNSSNESAQAGLYIGKIKKLKIPVPPIELQNQFADFIKQVDKLKFEM